LINFLKKSIKDAEELQRAFKVRWCDKENPQRSFSSVRRHLQRDLVKI
jgi:hypothetical protein